MLKPVYLIGSGIGLFMLIFVGMRNCEYSSNLIEVENSTEISLEVRKAFNERGIYVLNDSVFVGFAPLYNFDSTKYEIEDDALWRPKNAKHLPRLSDISAPFKITKKRYSDTILIIRNVDTFMAILN